MGIDFSELQDFIYDEVEYLDNARYKEWLGLFMDDGTYWVPTSPNQNDPLNEISLFYETSRLLEMRINRLLHSHVHSLASPFSISHVVGNVRLVSSDAGKGEAILSSRFHMHEYQDGRERHFSGKYTHHLVRDEGNWKIKMKRVDLINCQAPMEPIEIPI